jgi:hypothetical protein
MVLYLTRSKFGMLVLHAKSPIKTSHGDWLSDGNCLVLPSTEKTDIQFDNSPVELHF